MPRFRMSQDWISLGRDYTVEDENGDTFLRFDGHMLAIGNKLSIYDRDGNKVGLIDQRLLSWGPTYEIYRDGKRVAVMKKSFFELFGCSFSIDVPGPDDLTAKGDFFEHEYHFYQGDQDVARVSKSFFSLKDRYGIDISPIVDPVIILAGAAVIDLCCHEKKGH